MQTYAIGGVSADVHSSRPGRNETKKWERNEGGRETETRTVEIFRR